MSDALKLIRQELLSIKPFDSTRVGFENGLLLDANESPWDYYSEEGVQLNRYFDSMNDPFLLTTLSHYYQVPTAQILLTRGSCEGIDLIVRAFCRSYQDSIVVSPPTFSVFAQCALMQGASVISVPLQKEHNFALDPEELLAAVTDNTKLVFICTPNNPTGNLIPIDTIITIIKALQGKSMVIVDEAYMEFAQGQSTAQLVSEFSNLVVLRTLSKAFGLAGSRCGILIAQNPLIKILAGMMMPFPFALSTIHDVKHALTPQKLATMQAQIAYIQEQRDIFKADLLKLPLVKKIWNSEGNFLFVEFYHIQLIHDACQKNKVLVRHFIGNSHYENCLRISVGLEAENQQFIKMLQPLAVPELSPTI
jgi:histidinol-phosphate aminotransferase